MDLKIIQTKFQEFLIQENKLKAPEALYEPIQYLMNIGGKRIRPALALMAYNLYKDDVENALPIAYAIELFHNFTLMHDDIMDDATLRRGKPAVHNQFNINAAILSGDAMLLTAYKYLLQSGASVEDVSLFNQTAIEICEGQQMDMNFETADEVSIEEYLEMIKLKTAILLGLSLQLGAIKAGASTKDINHLYQFGINIGIAFQLHDDMLDAFGESAQTGKKIGGDIIQRKQTYLHLKTKELVGEKEVTEYLNVFNNITISDDDRVEKIMKHYKNTAVKEYSLQTEEAYFTLAMSHLDAVKVEENKKSVLRNLSFQLMERKH